MSSVLFGTWPCSVWDGFTPREYLLCIRNSHVFICATWLLTCAQLGSHTCTCSHTHTLLALFLGIGYLVYLCIVIKMGTRKSQIKGKLHGRSLVHTLKILGLIKLPGIPWPMSTVTEMDPAKCRLPVSRLSPGCWRVAVFTKEADLRWPGFQALGPARPLSGLPVNISFVLPKFWACLFYREGSRPIWDLFGRDCLFPFFIKITPCLCVAGPGCSWVGGLTFSWVCF